LGEAKNPIAAAAVAPATARATQGF